MEVFFRIISMLGGLALFLYGMRIMGDGLKSSSGGAMRTVLAAVTDKPIKGFLLGVLVTCMIQSSHATIVLTVGLVGAGFLTFRQSVSIVLGANVGTAITAQIIRLMDLDVGAGSILLLFKSDNLAPLALTVGIFFIMFKKGSASDTLGTIFMGFGILFIGLMNMSHAVSSMGQQLSHLLVSFEDNYILGFLSGVLVTGVIQSSSAVIGILQSVASSVGIRFCAVFAVIVGVNIGDCITAFLVCRIGAKREQIRSCLVHVIYNVIAATLIFTAIAIGRATGLLNDDIWYMTLRSGGVANVHGLFRLVPAVLILPFSGLLAGACEKLVPDLPEDSEDAELERNLRELDHRLITNPGMAIIEAKHLIVHMAGVALHNFEGSVDQIYRYEDKRLARIRSREDLLDRMADASNQYLVDIGPYIKRDADYRAQIYLIKALNIFERIGDLSMNVTRNVENIRRAGKEMNPQDMADLDVLADAVRDILTLAVTAFQSYDPKAAMAVEPVEEVIDELVEILRNRSVQRSATGKADLVGSLQYQNMLQNMERISDQCSDLAVYLIGMADSTISGREHEYLRELHHSQDSAYQHDFEEAHKKYFDLLDAIPVEKIPAKDE